MDTQGNQLSLDTTNELFHLLMQVNLGYASIGVWVNSTVMFITYSYITLAK